MRISDWSSDVCSSDLRRLGTPGDAAVAAYVILVLFEKNNILSRGDESLGSLPVANAIEEMPRSALDLVTRFRGLVEREIGSDLQISDYCKILKVNPARLSQACKELLGLTPISVVHEQKLMHAKRRSEHTSELQSLMRISYAVFCLKKKKLTTKQYHQVIRTTYN